MKVLVLGATGFIGAAVVDALRSAGERVIAGVRDAAAAQARWPGIEVRHVDFERAQLPSLAGVDAVVNAIGTFAADAERFEAMHHRAPVALFRACVAAGVGRVVQVSALGARADAPTPFLRSKNRADDALSSLPLIATILQPSLVFGAGGASTRLFLRLASQPVWLLPDGGRQIVQPVHVDDVAAAVVAALRVASPPRRIAAVGPRALVLRDYLQCLRRGLGRGRARVIAVPMRIAQWSIAVVARFRRTLVDPAALRMLAQGNAADPAPFSTLLGRTPRGCERFLPDPHVAVTLRAAERGDALALLRWTLALLWLASGWLSLFVHPRADSLQLLQRSGVPDLLAPAALHAAAGLDLLFGVLLLFAPRGCRGYRLQIATVVVYSLIIALTLPEFLLHPFAPVIKNLPVVAALWLLYREEVSTSIT